MAASGYTACMSLLPLFPTNVERWAALRTAGRWEKKLAATLAEAGIPVFLPLLTRFTTSHGKRRAALVPVFPGYVFCSETDFLANPRLTPGTRARVAQVLRPPDSVQLRSELRSIAELLADRQLVQERLVGGVGDVVRVVGGPLAGQLNEYLAIAEHECLRRKVGHEPQLWDRAFKMHLNLEKNGTMKLKNWDVKIDLCE